MTTRTGGWAPSLVRNNDADDRRQPGVPLVLAHRGAPAPDRPENTVAAATAALAAGADGLEVDVRLSADGQLLCSHDPDLYRLAGVNLPVESHTAAVLRRVRLPGGHTVALLDEVLTAVAEHGRCHVVVEAKSCADLRVARRLPGALADVLPAFASALDITVSCFDPDLLAAVRPVASECGASTALLGSTFDDAARLLHATVAGRHEQMHPNLFSVLRAPDVTEAARMLGIGVICWTVNRPRHVARLADLEVNGLITDDAPGVRAALRYRPGSDHRVVSAGRAVSASRAAPSTWW